MKVIHTILLVLFSLVISITEFWIITTSGEYYVAPQIERPHLAQHKQWKPGGSIGHGLGIIGSSMMIIMFSYSIRKRIRLFRKWGRLPTWLNYHIFLGITGPILVTFHTSFKFGGLVSISFWSMVAVALSGFIGRYIYIKIPRRVSGKEVTLQEFEEEQRQMTNKLVSEFKISAENIARIERLAGVDKIKKKGLSGIFTLFLLDFFSWFTQRNRYRRLLKSANVPPERIREFRIFLKKRVNIARQVAFWNTAHQLFHYWHVVHRPFAYTMIVIMIIHVIVAVTLGYTWIL